MKKEALRALAEVQRIIGLAFAAQVRLDPDVDEGGDEPRDPYAYSRVPRHPRTPLRSGAVALAEPEDDQFTIHNSEFRN